MIAPGASDTFQIQMDTATGGSRAGTVSFTSNDADEGAFDFAIKGSVATSPEVAVTGNSGRTSPMATPSPTRRSHRFRQNLVNAVVERTFTVTNTGTAP